MVKTLEAGKLIVGAIAVSIDPTGSAITILGIDSVLQAKNWFSKTPDLNKLAKELTSEFNTQLQTKRFDKPDNARALLPQMLEAAFPTAGTFTECDLDEDLILDQMKSILKTESKQTEFQTHEILTAFHSLVHPLIAAACLDARLIAVLNPLILKRRLKRQANLEALLTKLQTSENLSAPAKALAVQEAFIQRIAKNHLKTTPDDPVLALEEIERALEKYAQETERQQQGSNLDQSLQNALRRSDELYQEGEATRAFSELDYAEQNIRAEEERLREARISVIEKRITFAELESAPDIAAKAEADLLQVQLNRQPTIGELVDLAMDLEQEFNRFGRYFAGLTAVSLLETALDACEPEDKPDVVLGQLANALLSLGERIGDSRILAKSVLRYQDHSKMVPKSLIPNDWATAQNNLGNALKEQGNRTEGAKGADLLKKAVIAYRGALTVRTHDAHPADWAQTQNNLGNALERRGSRTDGAAGADLFDQAITAYRDALTVITRDAHPVPWAMTQNNLGIALQQQGSRTDGAAGADLFDQAVTAYRDALTVHTRDAHPVPWAMTQNNLGVALRNQGIRTDGAAGADLFHQAVTAYQDALTVFTHDAHPVQWAETHENIAITELARAEHDSTETPRPHLDAALLAVDNAMTVYNPQHLGYDHAKATKLRDYILAALNADPA